MEESSLERHRRQMTTLALADDAIPRFAQECGVDKAAVLEVLKSGPDRSAEARLSRHAKDVRLILAVVACRVPLSDPHRALLEEAEAAGYGAPDNSAIIEVFERKGVCGGNETGIQCGLPGGAFACRAHPGGRRRDVAVRRV
jgi:hypothetical protein